MSEDKIIPVCLSDEDRETLSKDLGRLFQTNWKLCDCIGVSIASEKDQLPTRYISEEAKTTMLEYAFSEANDLLGLLTDIQKKLGVKRPTFEENPFKSE